MTKTKTNGASTLRGRFAALRAALAAAMLEREGEIDAMLTALVAREHVVFLGIPGTGKSMLSRAIADAVTATHFEYLMTRFSTPDDFIGPYSLKALDHDSYLRVLKGRACDSEIVFLDEIFKSNAASLNALLPILNERVVHNDGKAVPIPLRMCVAASNEMPEGDELDALWDRILLRRFVEPVREPKNREAIMLGQFAPTPKGVLSIADVDEAAKEAAAMPLAAGVIDSLLAIRQELESQGMVYGDRRWVKAVRIVRAFAFVLGDATVDSYHLGILKDVLWQRPEQRAAVAKVVGSFVSPELAKATAAFDSVMDEATKLMRSADTKDIARAMQELKQAHKAIKALRDQTIGRTASEIESILGKLQAAYAEAKTSIEKAYNLGGSL